MSKMDDLQRERRNVAGWLFLQRCLLAWVPIAAFHLYQAEPISGLAMIFYVFGIPAGLLAYDRLILKRK